jgi:hypothetical protein
MRTALPPLVYFHLELLWLPDTSHGNRQVHGTRFRKWEPVHHDEVDVVLFHLRISRRIRPYLSTRRLARMVVDPHDALWPRHSALLDYAGR